MPNGNTYDPFAFATGITGIRGAFGGQGLLETIRQKGLDLREIERFVRRKRDEIERAQRRSSRAGLGAKLFGTIAAPLLMATGVGAPAALALSAAGAGLGEAHFKRKALSGLGAGGAPEVLFGKERLRSSVEDINRAVSQMRDEISPSALQTAISVPVDYLKFKALGDMLGALKSGSDVSSNIPSFSQAVAKGQEGRKFLSSGQNLLNFISPGLSQAQRSAFSSAIGSGGNLSTLLGSSGDLNRIYRDAISLRPFGRSMGLGFTPFGG